MTKKLSRDITKKVMKYKPLILKYGLNRKHVYRWFHVVILRGTGNEIGLLYKSK